jgi:hypothetical protein
LNAALIPGGTAGRIFPFLQTSQDELSQFLQPAEKSESKLLQNGTEKHQIPEKSSMKTRFLIAAILVLALKLWADETNSTPLMTISAEDATKYFNKDVMVTGKVAQVSIRPGIVFLNMDKPYPNSPFTLVIFPAATNQFGNLRALRGASVEATGKITDYHNRPEMVLEKKGQLNVTAPAPTNAPSMSHTE